MIYCHKFIPNLFLDDSLMHNCFSSKTHSHLYTLDLGSDRKISRFKIAITQDLVVVRSVVF